MAAVNTTSLTRISVTSAGVAGDGASFTSGLSTDGRYVLFYSNADNFAAGATTANSQFYLRDTATGTTTLVSAAPDGSVGNGISFDGSVSDDGRYVVFLSGASNLAGADGNRDDDIFVRDMRSGATFRISQAADGTDATDASGGPEITGDGRYAAFYSYAGNLVPGDTNGQGDVFVYDMLSGTNALVSLAANGSQGNGGSYNPDISADGRYVVFESNATNLVTGDTNGFRDVFLRDTVAGTTIRVSLGSGGAQGNADSVNAHVSDDGRYVVFESTASNLVAGGDNGGSDVFLRDTVAGTTKLVSANSGGVIGNGDSNNADISADGRYVVFESAASNLVADDTNGFTDIFLRDTVAGTTTRLSVTWNGAEANGSSYEAHISADGHTVTFESLASNLVRGDGNGQVDVFRVSLVATDAADHMIGSDGVDSLSGLGGADILDGGLGADALAGGAGNDTYIVDNPGDRIFEARGDGVDSVVTSVSYTLAAGQEIESLATASPTALDPINLTGNAFANTLTGNDGSNVLNGGAGADIMIGRAGSDTYLVDNAGDRVIEAVGGGTDRVLSSVSYALAAGQEIESLQLLSSTGSAKLNLTGNAFGQTLVGNNGANLLDGGLGNDVLIGRGGADTFVFSTTLGAGNVDHIADFATEDTIRLARDIFTALAPGQLADSAFKNISAGAVDGDDRILYKQATGELFYDGDGSGAGVAVKFAVLDNKVALDHTDFLIV